MKKNKKMKIILSRKGFDSKYGGYSSPILPDGRMISLPIPQKDDSIRYSDLRLDKNKTYYDIMKELDIKGFDGRCHLDPDIYSSVKIRDNQWKPLFGQSSHAQSHLNNKEVREGDLFLFFGTFRKTIITDEGKLKFDLKDRPKHIIFGYLQIEKIIRKNEEVEDWMEYHSHCSPNRDWKKNNTVYVATKKLSFNPNLSGAGVFNYDKSLVLTAEGLSKSRWKLPEFFRGKISYHKNKHWNRGYFQSVGMGQEFVTEEDPKIEKWAMELIGRNKRLF